MIFDFEITFLHDFLHWIRVRWHVRQQQLSANMRQNEISFFLGEKKRIFNNWELFVCFSILHETEQKWTVIDHAQMCNS